jgi:hypothetical protein
MSAPPGKSARELRAEQMAAQLATARAELAARAGKATAAEQARIIGEAQVRAKHETPKPPVVPLAAKLPPAARMALDPSGRVFNPKIHEKDVAGFKAAPIKVLPWLDAVGAKLRKYRQVGDVLPSIIRRIADVIGWGAQHTAKVEKTFKQIAEQAHCCIETARKAVRWLEAHDLLDTFNVLRRASNGLERGPNLYLPLVPDGGPVPAGAPVPADPGEAGAGDAPAEKLAPGA